MKVKTCKIVRYSYPADELSGLEVGDIVEVFQDNRQHVIVKCPDGWAFKSKREYEEYASDCIYFKPFQEILLEYKFWTFKTKDIKYL